MKRVLFALLFVAACKKPPVDATPTRDEFAKLARARLPGDLTYDPKTFAVVRATDGGVSARLNLANAYDEYVAADAAARERVLSMLPRAFESIVDDDVPQTFEAARAHLLPIVRDGIYFDNARRAMSLDKIDDRPITPLFHEAIAIDRPETTLFVTVNRLHEWKQSMEALRTIALTNLDARSKEPFSSPSPGLFRSPWNDSYDTSRILLPKRIAALAVKGAPVVMLPNRETLLVAGDRDPVALMAMADLGEQILNGPRAMTALTLRLGGDAWDEYVPEVTAEVKTRFARLRAGSLKSLYDEQKHALEDDAQKRKDDVFVAAYEAFDDGHEVFSTSALTRGAWTLLPVTERVMFVDAKEDLHDNTGMKPLGWAPWSRVMKVLGKAMKPMGLSPERYRIETFPTAAQLKALKLTPQ